VDPPKIEAIEKPITSIFVYYTPLTYQTKLGSLSEGAVSEAD